MGINVHGNFHPAEINNTHRYVPKLLLLSEQCEETGANCMLLLSTDQLRNLHAASR